MKRAKKKNKAHRKALLADNRRRRLEVLHQYPLTIFEASGRNKTLFWATPWLP